MKNLFSFIYVAILLIFSSDLSSQHTFTYSTILSFGNGQCSHAEQNSVLKIDHDQSIFLYSTPSLEGGQKSITKKLKGGFDKVILDSIGIQHYYNRKTNQLLSRELVDGKALIISEDAHAIKWQLRNTSKMIGEYRCAMAIAEFRGRIYTAWYTPDVPTSFGPWKLHGLPGLVVEAYDDQKEVCFYLKSINDSYDGLSVTKPTSGEHVSLDGYWTHYKDYVKLQAENGRLLAEQLGIKDYKPFEDDTIIEIPHESHQ